jgi:two-component system chemotaxis response regulator CheY
MRTLIVEDDFTNRVLLQTFLGKYGECHVALNGKEAVAAFRTALETYRAYNLICMDVVMPEMNGHEAVKQIRECEKSFGVLPCEQVRIIMTTALSDETNILKSAKEECDGYLVKPVNTRMLLNHLECFGLLKDKQDSPVSR